MSPRIINHRRVICRGCPNPCPAYTQGILDHADPKLACPDRRFDAMSPDASPHIPGAAPSIGGKLRHFTSAFLKWSRAGFPRRTKAQVKSCLDICHTCPSWRKSGNFGLGECTHPKCGCTKFKPQWATEDCPANKWPSL